MKKFMNRSSKKGFTIVELVIVIAVIAILAAVLIPTFSNIIKKANISADIQACRQMNEYLAINEVTEGDTIYDVFEALAEGGMDAEDYKPLTSDTFYFWDSTLNRILYTDNDYNVTYPEEYTSVTKADHQWYSLSGTIKAVQPSGYTSTSTSVTVSSAEELYYVAQSNNTQLTTITLAAGTIDVMGADVGFSVNSSVTLAGDSTNGTTINGLCQAVPYEASSSRGGDNAGKAYGSGLITAVGNSAKNANITISNITIANSVIGDLETGSVGGFIGKVGIDNNTKGSATLTNCHIVNCVINGKNKVGGLIGGIWSCNVTISDCSVDGCTINASEGEAGKVIGAWYGSGSTLTINKQLSEMVDTDSSYGTTTLNLVDSASGSNELHRELINKSLSFKYLLNGTETTTNITGLAQKFNVKNGSATAETSYRPFDSTATMTMQAVNDNGYTYNVKVGSADAVPYTLKFTNSTIETVDGKTLASEFINYEDLIQ